MLCVVDLAVIVAARCRRLLVALVVATVGFCCCKGSFFLVRCCDRCSRGWSLAAVACLLFCKLLVVVAV